MNFDDIKDKLVEQKDNVEKGLDKAAELAKGKIHGHDGQIDSGVEKVKDYLEKTENTEKTDERPAGTPGADPGVR